MSVRNEHVHLLIACYVSLLLVQCEATDLAVTMQQMWKTLGGPSPYWSGTDICNADDFIGVTCNGFTGPTSINLSSIQLSGQIPSNIGVLTNLTSLIISNTHLNGSIPSSIGDLSSLNVLQLYNLSLSGVIPPSIGNLTSLTSLSLSYNFIEGNITSALSQLSLLTELSLDHNRLSGIIPNDLVNLRSLEYFHLEDNLIGGPLPSWLGELTQLIDVNLVNNRLTGPIPPSIGNLTQLVHLSLSQNQLNGSLPPQMARLTRLAHLFIGQNNITGPFPSFLQNLTLLEDVYLGDNFLTGQIPAGVINLPLLRLFDVSSNFLGGAVSARDSNLNALSNLFLGSNSFTSVGYIAVTAVCDLSDNRLPCYPPLKVPSICSLNYLPCGSTDILGLYNNMTTLTTGDAEVIFKSGAVDPIQTVEVISAVALALSRNTSASFEYKTSEISLTFQTYNLTLNDTIHGSITDSNISVILPLSTIITGQVHLLLSSLSFNPFASIVDQIIYSPVVGVSVYSNGRKVQVSGVREGINISMGTIGVLPPGHKSSWSREGCNIVVDGDVIICQSTHLTNFSIGVSRIETPTTIRLIDATSVDESPQGNKKLIIIIIASCAGGVMLLLLLTVIVYLSRRRAPSEIPIGLEKEEKNGGTLEWMEKIHDGEYSQVWRAIHNGTTTVAAKKVQEKDVRKLMQEALRLKSFHHPKIVLYLGQNLSERWMAIEWMHNGSLFSYSQSHPIQRHVQTIMTQVVQGMLYLSDQNIVHTQLTPHHILLRVTDDTVEVKVSGLSESVADGAKHNKKPEEHTAPEVIRYGRQYIQSDVWSFGLVLTFIMNGGPHEQKEKMRDLTVKVLIHDCTEEEMTSRTTFAQIAQKLKGREECKERESSIIVQETHDNEDPYSVDALLRGQKIRVQIIMHKVNLRLKTRSCNYIKKYKNRTREISIIGASAIAIHHETNNINISHSQSHRTPVKLPLQIKREMIDGGWRRRGGSSYTLENRSLDLAEFGAKIENFWVLQRVLRVHIGRSNGGVVKPSLLFECLAFALSGSSPAENPSFLLLRRKLGGAKRETPTAHAEKSDGLDSSDLRG
ncbi:hypothetical protein PROFUN_13164 [Planoprotostelium fungivorum]|uniref:Uncharacterized protein n=1 Tax=Planoprotostelium fungivorum TaxID=1890364 RepID=A0A2P6N581_9EUKA|nr:hypothetical protein PROFUN_13164 [Planoprotostelium fungivorum]